MMIDLLSYVGYPHSILNENLRCWVCPQAFRHKLIRMLAIMALNNGSPVHQVDGGSKHI